MDGHTGVSWSKQNALRQVAETVTIFGGYHREKSRAADYFYLQQPRLDRIDAQGELAKDVSFKLGTF